jgi:hypothetical protein
VRLVLLRLAVGIWIILALVLWASSVSAQTRGVTAIWDVEATHDAASGWELEASGQAVPCTNARIVGTERRCDATVPASASAFRLRMLGAVASFWSDAVTPPGGFSITFMGESSGTTPPPPPPPPVTDNLVGYWRLDEGGGTTTLDAAGPHPGTLNGPAWTAGRVGQAVRFDGADDFIDLGSLDVAGSALTIAAWIRPDGFPIDDGRIVSKSVGPAEQDHYFMLSTVSSGGYRLRFRLKAGGSTTTLVASSGVLSVGQWAYAAAVYNGSAMILYLNGAEVGRVAKTGTIATNASVPVAIGRNPQAYGAFQGAIDEVRLYQRALTVADIQGLAQP